MSTIWVLLIVHVGGSVMIDPNQASWEECQQNAHHYIRITDEPITTRCMLLDVPAKRKP